MWGTEELPPRAAVQQMVTIYFVSHAVRAMAELGLADYLADGPRTVEDLAEASGTDTSTLARFLRTLAGLGLCATEKDGRARLTLTGELLRRDIPNSMRPFALAIAAPYIQRVWEELPEAIRTGEPMFHKVHGLDFWGYLSGQPEEEALFDDAMSGAVVTRANALLSVVDLSAIGTLVDIGGGQGWLLAAALEAHPNLRGVLFDRPEVLSRAGTTLAGPTPGDRCRFVSGDFFASVPDNGDAYILSLILHDWADTEAIAILRTCHRAMRSGARMWIVEQVIEPGDTFDRGKLIDLHMLVLFGARERTAKEYQSLLEVAGFCQVRFHKTDTPFCIVEAQRG